MDLTTALHATKCHSYRNGTCDGTSHLALYRPMAARIIAAEDPAEQLHSTVCDALIDPTFWRCPDHDRHVAHLRRWLEQQGVLDLEVTP